MADAPPVQAFTGSTDTAQDAASKTSPPPPVAAPAPASSPLAKSNIYARLPLELRSYASHADRSLVRLNSLLSTTAGLDSFLVTLNYAFYLLAYLETRLPARTRLLELLSLALRRPRPKATTAVGPSTSTGAGTSLTLLAALITDLRTTLRLTALLPLYTWLRSLLSPPASTPPPDSTLQLIALTQCTAYLGYQALENLAHLTDLKIPLLPIPKSYLAGPGSTKTWLLSNRLWVFGVTCDFARLARQAVLERAGAKANSVGKKKINRSEAEQQAVDRQWWNELLVASCWWPLCLHWSLEQGLWGVNDGVIGLLGVVAGLETFRGLWIETDQA